MDEEKEKRIKVLVSAYACEPNKGSEPAVGWSWVKAISQVADEVWVITRANNRIPIEEGLKNNPLPNVHWIYFDLPNVLRFWKRGQFGVHLYYILWQIGIYWVAKKLVKEKKIDLVHHVTFVNYYLPTWLWLMDVPFIWGPVGGGESIPFKLYNCFSFRGKLVESCRILFRWMLERIWPIKQCIKKSKCILAVTNETRSALVRLCPYEETKISVFSQIMLADDDFGMSAKFCNKGDKKFRFVSVGRLVYWKGFSLSMRAFASRFRDIEDVEYWIFGDGPERMNLLRLAKQLDVHEKVIFWGKVPRSALLRNLSQCDILVHPSFHDSGGWVIVEAMMLGKPVICLDIGGPSVLVGEGCGVKITPKSCLQIVEELSNAMWNLYMERDMISEMEKKSSDFVLSSYHWKQNIPKLKALYNR